MSRRYAILDDNQQMLEQRLDQLARALPPLIASRVAAAGVIGSVAEGRARDGSDLDVVLVLKEGEPRRGDYECWDAAVAPALSGGARFPVQPLFIALGSLATTEPNLRRALARCIVLWDPEGIIDDQSEARP